MKRNYTNQLRNATTANSNTSHSTDTGTFVKPNYQNDTKLLEDFFRTFPNSQQAKYLKLIKECIEGKRKCILIELEDLYSDAKYQSVLQPLETNILRYKTIIESLFDKFSLEIIEDSPHLLNQNLDELLEQEQGHVFYRQRIIQYQQQQQQQQEKQQEKQNVTIPKELLRKYELLFSCSNQFANLKMRQIDAKMIGHLVKLKGIVSRCSDVKSELQVACYVCEQCGNESYQLIKSRSFMPIVNCGHCKQQKKGKLFQQTRGSKFVKFQQIKIVECTDEVPNASIPRQLHVILRGELTRTCSPGDLITVTGIYLPNPIDTNKARRTGLMTTTAYVEALQLDRNKKRYEDYSATNSTVEVSKMIEDARRSNSTEFYSKLSNSIAPEIFGLEDVKKALLLMLIGGVNRSSDNNTESKVLKIRGDINVCLMGDPGVAKSQLLRVIAQLSPRGVYTTGKGSSGVGLTAAVVKDSLTGELTLEGGSLVLADNGICCIDEFDKMDESDRTALHEVMEQQSISIAKAGISTTLNARASVLAAANPAYGRYNLKKSPAENINMPPALLSRFDLLFLLLDKQDDSNDIKLAKHIGYLHKHSKAPTNSGQVYFDHNYLRSYIGYAKQFNPFIPKELTSTISDMYVSMREKDANRSNNTTPRTLLAILRLSQSLAKLRFSNRVCEADILEAKRLMEVSKISLENSSANANQQNRDPLSTIYDIIRNAMNKDTKSVRVVDVKNSIIAKGLSMDHLDYTLDYYSELSVWHVNSDKTLVTFL